MQLHVRVSFLTVGTPPKFRLSFGFPLTITSGSGNIGVACLHMGGAGRGFGGVGNDVFLVLMVVAY